MSTKKILVVDDNPVIVKGLALKLKSAGYEVLEAEDASSAFKVVREHDPDLLILDINFPADINMTWDGFTVMQWLERLWQDTQKPKPVIIITGEESPKYEDRAKAAGAVAFFRKPVDNAELLKVVARTLDAKDSASKPAA
ncbi:MAG TPA: response regulator [Verrucomicrobiae bacterium]